MPQLLRWASISRALARHDPATVYALLRERLGRAEAGRALVALVRTVPDWPKGKPSHTDAITPAELVVLIAAAEGMSVNETARHLYVSPHTVSSHRKSIIYKLGARTMTDAVAAAYKSGLLP
jgi:DNA-binding NarL/FixJ family response regulator